MLLRPVLDARDPVLDEVTEFFAPDEHSTPFLVLSATPMPSLADRGWTLMGHPPLMLRAAGPADVPAPDGLEIVEVRDDETLAEFDRTMIEIDRRCCSRATTESPSTTGWATATRRDSRCGSAGAVPLRANPGQP